MSEFGDEMEEVFGKKIVKGVVALLVIVLLYTGIAFVSHIWPFSSAVGVATRVTNPDKILSDYHYFYDQIGVIRATERNIDDTKRMLLMETLLPSTRERMAIELQGQLQVLSYQIQEYNQKSKQFDRALWKAKDLPYEYMTER